MIPHHGTPEWRRLPSVVTEDLDRICERVGSAMDRIADKRVLITGAGGTIASYLLHTLLHLQRRGRRAPEIVAVVRNPIAARRRFLYTVTERLDRKIHWVQQDLRQSDTWEGSADYYVHAASPASPRAFLADPLGTAAVNTSATDRLLARAAARGVEAFLFFSSSEVYGDMGPGEIFVSEDRTGVIDPLSPRSIYPESKRMGEAICAAWHRCNNLPTRIARIFHTYGPGIHLQDERVFADFTARALRNEEIVLRSDGRGRRAFCYLADTVAGLLTILLRGADGHAYNVGNRHGILSIRELADLVAGLAPEPDVRVRLDPDPDRPESASAAVFPDTAKLEQLGWKAEVAPRDGFARTLESFREMAE